MKRNLSRLVTLLCALPFSTVAMAHTGNHAVSGLLSGMLHPWLGLDHVVAMLAIGLWVGYNFRRTTWLPVIAFLVFVAAGALLGLAGNGLPGVEAGIAVSVLVMGLLLATLAHLPVTTGVALVGVFALFHGNAHGIAIPLVDASIPYVLGLLASTAILLLSGRSLARLAQQTRTEYWTRGAGLMAGGFGAWLLLGV